ncbi:phage replisome organizer N-terminal domain-containing protein [Enterococcus mundtii]|uniref:phage replisome organizer N-terminal domain-containing protein n=1 Tax=Enterococcus mundtii TaxID=53346 RepID=UPI0008EFF757|nr:phage replisome organizer N-terminal domain-containing protein [Enterococcus mundtii]SFL74812.1 phage replisome organizer, putative, N-terminal region [Enterococcus mundtii]
MSDKQKKRYYWLKLKEDFFEEDTIEWLEEQPNGKEYCLFYLKLCLKSLKTEGLLVRNVGNLMIPYDPESLARLTSSNADTVKVAMDLFNKIGLIKILDSGEIYLNQLSELVGSETEYARQKRVQRAREDNVQKLSGKGRPELEKELDIEKELEEDKDIEKQDAPELKQYSIQIYSYIEKNGFGSPYGNTMGDNINFWLKDLEEAGLTIEQADAWMIHGVNTAIENNNRRWNYLEGILKNRFNKRLFSKSAIEGEEEMRKSQQVKSISRSYQKNVRREKLPEWANKSQEEKELDPQQKAEIDARFKAYLAQKAQEEKEDDC